MRTTKSLATGFLLVLSSQMYSQLPSFEVASVKVRPTGRERGSTGRPPVIHTFTGLLAYSDVTLRGVIERAYVIDADRIEGPAWIDEVRYDITAEAPVGTSGNELNLMLENLLAERFGLRAHWDSRQAPVYALTAGKTELRLAPAKPSPTPREKDPLQAPNIAFTVSGPFRIMFKDTTLDGFADGLSPFLDRPVINSTGVSGRFDISISCSADSVAGFSRLASRNSGATSAQDSMPSIFTAIHELGLNLEPRKASIKKLIVDFVSRVPTEN